MPAPTSKIGSEFVFAFSIVTLLLSLQTFAKQIFDPSSRFPSRDAYCTNVQSLASALFANVKINADALHTTFADVISHNAFNSLNVRGVENIDPADYAGMLAYLSGWDTTLREGQARQRAAGLPVFDSSSAKQNRIYSDLIDQTCRNNTLRFSAPGYCPAGEGCSAIGTGHPFQ